PGGRPPDPEVARQVKQALPHVPLILAGGISARTLPDVFEVADGVIVGTGIKEEGQPWGGIDPDRALAFMRRVRDLRGG
ncbi:MAG: BtpA/SgcQ family protein, partial [Chloroflexota bacterium]